MWKSRPVVASRVGGIADQVISGETGWLIDPHDLADCADRVCTLLDDSETAAAMGAAGHERAKREYLADRHLEQWATLFEQLPA